MAVKARAQITLTVQIDIQSVWWYYKLQSSTAAKPAKPTTNPPSGWTLTEPSYTEGSTNTLYFVELTVFTDGSFQYTDVSVDSGYEAAKAAYNKAVAAQNAANANADAIGAVEQRVSTAEQKITSDAIVSTVRSSASYKSDLAAKADAGALADYAKTSELKQTADAIKLSVTKIENGTTPIPYVKTSYIEVKDDHVNIGTGGAFNVGAADVEIDTDRFTMILGDDEANPAMSFTSESKDMNIDGLTARIVEAKEVVAGNLRPYITSRAYTLSTDFGGSLAQFAALLKKTTFGYCKLNVDVDDTSVTPVTFDYVFCNQLVISSNQNNVWRQLPSMDFLRVTGEVLLQYIKWQGSHLDVSGTNYFARLRMAKYRFTQCWAFGAQSGIYLGEMAEMLWQNSTSSDAATFGSTFSKYFVAAYEGAQAKVYGYVPAPASGAKYYTVGVGSEVKLVNVTGVSGSVTPAVTPATSMALTFGSGTTKPYYKTYYKSAWHTGELRQGRTSAKGLIYGCLFFALPSAAKAIKSAVLTLTRKSGVGKGDYVDVCVWNCKAGMTESTSPVSYLNNHVQVNDLLLGGQTKSIDVTALVSAMKTGGLPNVLILYIADSGLMSGKAYSSNYAQFSAASLSIQYS